MTKDDCINYDWGDTAPKAYGAFCKLTKRGLGENTCENCNNYKHKVPTVIVGHAGQGKSSLINALVKAENEINEAIKLLRSNGYVVKKYTEAMRKDAGECDGKDCASCACNDCLAL